MKFCDICGKKTSTLMEKWVYVECTPDGEDSISSKIETCNLCNYKILQAGIYSKIVAEVEVYKNLKETKSLRCEVNNTLLQVANCLVVEKSNVVQVLKNRDGDCKLDEVKKLDFIRVTKDSIYSCTTTNDYVCNCDIITKKYSGKNVWYVIE